MEIGIRSERLPKVAKWYMRAGKKNNQKWYTRIEERCYEEKSYKSGLRCLYDQHATCIESRAELDLPARR